MLLACWGDAHVFGLGAKKAGTALGLLLASHHRVKTCIKPAHSDGFPDTEGEAWHRVFLLGRELQAQGSGQWS